MKRLIVITLALLFSSAAASLHAQSANESTVHFGLMGGGTTPVGDVALYTKEDWTAGALVIVGASSSHLRFRVDGQWQQIGGIQPLTGGVLDSCLGCDHGGGQPSRQDYRVLDVTTNAVFDVAPNSRTSLYLIGGVGGYNMRQLDVASGESASMTRFGINAGAGVRFQIGRLHPFVEVRYHDIIGAHTFAYDGGIYQASQTFQFIPFTAGIVF